MADGLPRIEVKFRKEALPDGLDLGDTAAVRAWARGLVDREARDSGEVEPVIRILCSDKHVIAPLDGIVDVGQEAMLAAYWHALGSLDEARHRLRVGTVILGAEGAARRAAFVMSWTPHIPDLQVGDELPKGLPAFGARWWLAYRFFGHVAAGTGVLHGEWVERDGVDFEGLDEPFRELLDSEGYAMNLPPLEWQPDKGPQMWVEWAQRGGGPAPTTAREFVEEIGMLTDREIVETRNVDGLWVFAFHGEWAEWWRIRGDVPCSLEDVLRNVAKFAGAEAIGALTVSTVTFPDGSSAPAAIAMAEFAGQRAKRAMYMAAGPDGKPKPVAQLQDLGAVPADAAWIGVEPGHDMQIKTESVHQMGKGGRPGPPLAEG